MQVQIRNPVAVEVETADDQGSVSFRFFTAADHEAVVTVSSELLPDLLAQLHDLVAEQKPQPVKPREFTVIERKAPPAKPREFVPEPSEQQPLLRALLQA